MRPNYEAYIYIPVCITFIIKYQKMKFLIILWHFFQNPTLIPEVEQEDFLLLLFLKIVEKLVSSIIILIYLSGADEGWLNIQ